MRLWPRTLRWRLTAWIATVVAISFGVTFIAVYRGTGSAVSQQIQHEISGDGESLQRTLVNARPNDPSQAAQIAAAYVRSQPFRSSTTLLFVLIKGQRLVTNQPELLAAQTKPESNESADQQAIENRSAAKLLSAPSGYSTVNLPDVGALRLLRRDITLVGRQLLPSRDGDDVRGRSEQIYATIGVGEPLASVKSAQAGVAGAFILAGILVLIGALISAYILGTRISSPLRRMAAVATRVDAGDLQPRIADEGHPAEELKVLADSFNHMLDRLTGAFARQRAFVADASHELRTPLTVIRGQMELLLAQDQPPPQEVARVGALVQAETARIARLVDDLLVLAKAERREMLHLREIEIVPFIESLWEGMKGLADRNMQLTGVQAGSLRADPDRLAQAIRNLLVNAIDHTAAPSGLVRLSVLAAEDSTPVAGLRSLNRTAQAPAPRQVSSARGERHLRILVEDDGPGIPEQERELVFERFHRIDHARGRAGGGAGLGLSIVRAIAIAHGGWARAEQSTEGGARMEIELPGFHPQASSERSEERTTAVAGAEQPGA